MQLTETMSKAYKLMWASMLVRPGMRAIVNVVASQLLINRGRYERVAKALRMPWELVAVIHMMESSGDFRKHLHNGDPLERQTVNVPAGRPPGPAKPGGYTWEESALDALASKGASLMPVWDVPRTLHFLETFNGFGYRYLEKRGFEHEESPYLWSMSSVDTLPGKFVADGKFDPRAGSSQVGAAVLLQALGWQPAGTPAGTPVVKPVYNVLVPIPEKEKKTEESMGVFQAFVLGILNRLLGELWTAFWVFISEKLAEAERDFKDSPNSGAAKMKQVRLQVREYLKPRVDRLPFFVRPFVWSGIDSLLSDLLDTINELIGKDWVGYIDNADDRVAHLIEPLLKQDLNMDGIVGPPPVVTTTTTTVKTTGGT